MLGWAFSAFPSISAYFRAFPSILVAFSSFFEQFRVISSIVQHCRPFPTICGHCRIFSCVFQHFRSFSSIFAHFRAFSTTFENFQVFSSIHTTFHLLHLHRVKERHEEGMEHASRSGKLLSLHVLDEPQFLYLELTTWLRVHVLQCFISPGVLRCSSHICTFTSRGEIRRG